ncbi:acyl-CoA N-acyltransferase [Xylariaceae sp. FL0662B]|nr:acyl-CoA N-acyltransferase [Xylariaceae sp. FL0662B]
MPFVARPVKHADVAQCVSIRIASLGSLVIGRPPPYPGYVQESEDSLHFDLDNSPHVHHLKVIDTENEEEVIAYAKWEVYERGRPDLEKLRQLDATVKEVDQYGRLREVAHEHFSRRNGEMGKHPHLLLALVTASHHRRRGAGSLMVRWGIDLSEETGLPCYLQASEQGRCLYRRHGFQVIDTVRFNLSEYGLEGVEEMTEMIRKPSVVATLEVQVLN